jgi:SOS-response transcriptional repressor LexA
MKNLTDRQKQLKDFIVAYQEQNQKIPTLQTMAGSLGVSVARIQHIIGALKRKKFLVRENIYKILSPANGVPLVEAELIKNPDAKVEDFNILKN